MREHLLCALSPFFIYLVLFIGGGLEKNNLVDGISRWQTAETWLADSDLRMCAFQPVSSSKENGGGRNL